MEANIKYIDLFSESIKDLIISKNSSALDLFITKEKFCIDVIELARVLGLNVKYEMMNDEQSGYIEDNEIHVNSNHHINRQRFTIAHEIAHYLLDHKGVNKRTSDSSLYTFQQMGFERAANDLAANLLMPESQVEALYKKFLEVNELDTEDNLTPDQTYNLVEYMSDKLCVSNSAMNYRLLNLGII